MFANLTNFMGKDFSQLIPEQFRPNFDFPRYNVVKDTETGKFVYQFALAGYTKDQITVKLLPGVLEVCGKEVTIPDKTNFFWKGFKTPAFRVSIALPSGADVTSPEFKNGVLSFEVGEDISFKAKFLPIVGG